MKDWIDALSMFCIFVALFYLIFVMVGWWIKSAPDRVFRWYVDSESKDRKE